MKRIKISGGYETIVDDDDYEILSQYMWSCNFDKHWNIRVVRRGKVSEPCMAYSMPRVILNCPKNLVVDHINHNQLDNRKQNLRICTRAKNKLNSKQYRNSTSGYKGVYYDCRKLNNPWIPNIMIGGKRYYGKASITKEQAALEYNILAKKYFGAFACYNNIMAAQ